MQTVLVDVVVLLFSRYKYHRCAVHPGLCLAGSPQANSLGTKALLTNLGLPTDFLDLIVQQDVRGIQNHNSDY